MQKVQASLLPFHLHRKTLEVPNGLTLEDMAAFVFPNQKLPGIRIVININDEIVPRHMWKSIRPKAGTIVGINAVAAGGGKKNPLATVIMVALIIAAPYVIGALAPTLAAGFVGTVGPFTAGQFALAQGIVRVGIALVGFLATTMLSSVPKQNNPDAVNATESPTQFIEGAQNELNRYGVIPVPLGVNRMFPPQGALPYTETSANLQYVRQLMVYGFGNNLQITDRKIGETPLSDYNGVEMNDRLTGNLNSGTQLYSNDVVQDGYSVTVSSATGYITRTTQPNTDEAQVELTFAQGLTQYNASAQRFNATVAFEIRYAITGTTDWINRATNITYGSQSVVVSAPVAWNAVAGKRIGYSILVINLSNGVASAISYDVGSSPIVPPNSIRIASFTTESTSPIVDGSGDIKNLIDERSNYIPDLIINSGDFALSYGGTGLSIGVAGGTLAGNNLTVVDATSQALRIVKPIRFPVRGQYDIQIKRLTTDSNSDQIRDVATLSAIRSIRYTQPVNQPNVCGTAIRMLGTDQLNGTIDRYNVIVSALIKDYDEVLDIWVEDVITSNPASIYRYVLQASAFVKALPDARIDLEQLQAWHIWCTSKGLTYNKIIDQPTSIDDLLNDIAAAGMATPQKINGIYSVIIDNERPDIKGMVTPRNSWGYNGTITYPGLPDALRVQFRNAAAGYINDERIVYADGFDDTNAVLFEQLKFDSCTNSDLAWFYGRIYMATAKLQPEVHNFNQDFENLTFNRGDKIVFVNDAILVGVGQGRIKELIYDNDITPTQVISFTIDDVVNIPTVDNFGVRIRHGDASGFIYYGLMTTIGDADTFEFSTPVPIANAPPLDSLCAFTQFDQELELVITEIRMNKDHTASVTAVNYAPERYNAVSGVIPPFSTNITLPANFYRPVPPILAAPIQSDESVMLKNSDGSYTTRMVIALINNNEPGIQTTVRVRSAGATQFYRPDILSETSEQIIITGLEDGAVYDLRIFYQRTGGLDLLSQALELNNVTYLGAVGKPDNVADFHLTVSDSIGLFQWTANQDLDLSHYVMRFTRVTSGATWVASQVVADNITSNRVNTPIQSGTYLIKAVDILGNESLNATIIISSSNGELGNVVQTLTEDPGWAGTKSNISVDGSNRIILTDPTARGYYYFNNSVDLSEVYENVLSSTLIAGGIFYDPSLSTKVRSLVSVRGTNSIRGTEATDWAVFLEMRLSNDGADWGPGWIPFLVGKQIFRFAEFRIRMESYNELVTPFISEVTVVIDMPDRIEKDRGVTIPVPSSGAAITYSVPFKADPSVNITLQNGAVDDKIEYVSKTEAGFTIKVYNATAAAYVDRTFDYISAGYGRIIS